MQGEGTCNGGGAFTTNLTEETGDEFLFLLNL